VTQTILFLAASPGGANQRSIDRQARAIQMELERGGCRSCFAFETRWAAQPLDLLHTLRALKPAVVHFSGHGSRDAPPSHGLFFQGLDGRARLVSAAAITETFGAAGASVDLVVLDACYTAIQAQALLAHVDCVVAVGGALHDDAARSFAIGFYGGLGEGESVAAAFRQGLAAIKLEGAPERSQMQLMVRPGVDPERLVVAVSPPSEDRANGSVRQVHAVNYAEQDLVIQNQVVHLAPDASEQEREARHRRLARTHRLEMDRRYRNDPMMRHRHSESRVLSAAGLGIAGVGVIALALGQLPLGIMIIAVVGVGLYGVMKRARRSG
jgi:hypothetical protein